MIMEEDFMKIEFKKYNLKENPNEKQNWCYCARHTGDFSIIN